MSNRPLKAGDRVGLHTAFGYCLGTILGGPDQTGGNYWVRWDKDVQDGPPDNRVWLGRISCEMFEPSMRVSD